MDLLIPDMGYKSLLLQTRRGFFKDVTVQSGISQMSGQYTSWGGLLVDFDNDGHVDLFMANGNAHHLFKEEATLAHNDGKGFNIQIETVPLDGRITLRVPSEKAK